MSDRERELLELIDQAAPMQTPVDRERLRESLAYGNLKLEDSSLTYAAISAAARGLARDR